MYFGDFLIQSGIISHEQLLDALAHQLEKTPTMLRLCLESHIISHEVLISIVKSQVTSKQDFLTTVRNAALLNEEQITILLQLQHEARPLLGRILVQRNLVTAEKLAMLLDEFHVLKNQSPVIEAPVQVGFSSPAVDRAAEISLVIGPTCESIPEFDLAALEDGMTEEFLEFFDQNKRQEIETMIIDWAQSLSVDLLRHLYRDMHTLKGTSRFLKAFLSEYIIHNLENVVTEAIRGIDKLKENLQFVSELEAHFLRGLDVLWTIRGVISDEHTEAPVMNNEKQKKEITQIVTISKSLQDRLMDLQSEISLEDFSSKF